MTKEFSVGDEVWVIDPHRFKVEAYGNITSIEQFYDEEEGYLDYIVDNWYPAKKQQLFSSELEAIAKCLELLDEHRKALLDRRLELTLNKLESICATIDQNL